MATVKKKRISWTPSTDPDVVGQRIYVAKEGETIDPDQTSYVHLSKDQAEIIAPDGFPPGTFDEDANYIVGLCSEDDVGNLSDIIQVQSPFDFVAPSAPTNLTVTAL